MNNAPWPDENRERESARDCVIRALHAGLNIQNIEGDTPREKTMALALHYGDILTPHKPLLQKAYHELMIAPHQWPASHALSVAGQWLKIVNLHTGTLKDTWRSVVLLGMAHRIVMAWFEAQTEDDWLEAIDHTTTQTWPFIENTFL